MTCHSHPENECAALQPSPGSEAPPLACLLSGDLREKRGSLPVPLPGFRKKVLLSGREGWGWWGWCLRFRDAAASTALHPADSCSLASFLPGLRQALARSLA